MLNMKSSAEPGHWRTDKAPYQREIMDAIGDPHTSKVVVMSAAQMGKTDGFILNAIGYYMDYTPAPIMVMEPTIQMGESFSKDRLAPMLRDTPALREKVDDRSRNSGNTILQKQFPGGHVTIVGANSPASLAMRPIKVLLADEIDRYPASAGTEGDPLMLAEKRQTTFWDKKEVVVSTPTIKGTSRIEVEYQHSTQEEWNVPCPNCGHYQPLVWANIKFDPEAPQKVEYACARCGCIENEYRWKAAGKYGKYIAANPGAPVRGFHLNTISSPFCSWREIVDKFLTAKKQLDFGDPELMKVWINTELGECWDEPGETMEDAGLCARREFYPAEVPDEVILLTCGVDTQDDRFELEVVGWGVGKESWGIRYQKIYGDPLKDQIWEELDEFLLSTFHKADGTELPIYATCMDTGGHHADRVLRFCKERFSRNVFAIKGRGGPDTPFLANPTKNNRIKAPLFTIGVDTGKALVYQRLRVAAKGPNYCHFPADPAAGYDETYFKGLTAEKMVIRYRKGHAVVTWELKEGIKRNEPLDIRNYLTAALEIKNPQLKAAEQTGGPPKRRKGRRIISRGVQ